MAECSLPTLRWPQALRLLLWARGATLRAELRALRQKSRLMLAVLGAFALGYLRGRLLPLSCAASSSCTGFPSSGTFLAERILYLIFGFFFVMLVFSNAIIGYAGLFKNRETNFLLSLPIRSRDIYLWKLLESLFLASWALLYLSAPMMIAWGRANDTPGSFTPRSRGLPALCRHSRPARLLGHPRAGAHPLPPLGEVPAPGRGGGGRGLGALRGQAGHHHPGRA